MNKQAASDLLCGLLDFIAGIPPVGARGMAATPEFGMIEDELQARAVALRQKADQAWEAGDQELSYRLQKRARMLEEQVIGPGAQAMDLHA
jgi:hypothetical protein